MNKTKDRIVEAVNLSVLTKDHVDKWVALSSDRKKLLAVEDSLSSVLNKTSGFAEKVVIKVLPNLGYAPVCEI